MVAMLEGIVRLASAREQLPALPQPAGAGDVAYVRSPAAVSRLALSYGALAADIYWIRTIQYYGGTRLSTDPAKTFDRLQPMLDLTTSLDPYFNIAYRFGAIFLAEPFPAGAGRPDQAIALLTKGLETQPGRWEFAYDIGFVHYWWRQDFQQAAQWFLRASEIADAPSWLEPLAAVVLTEGGSRASSRVLWQQILETAEVEWLRRSAEVRLRQLDALDHIERLAQTTRRYEAAGGSAESLPQLVAAGVLRQLPVDPEGYYYVLDAQRGVITLNPESPLNPLPVPPPSFRDPAPAPAAAN
jgi:hypothetical protein